MTDHQGQPEQGTSGAGEPEDAIPGAGSPRVRLPDPVAILTDPELVLDLPGAMELARAYLDVDALEHAAAVSVRAGGSGDFDVRAAGGLIAALIELAEGNPKKALKTLKPLNGFSDMDVAAEVFLLTGMAMEARGKWADADANYRMAMGLPQAVTAGLAALHLGRIAVTAGRLDDAGAMFDAAVGCGVAHVTGSVHLELALFHDRAGNHEDAVQHYRLAVTSPYEKTSLHAAFNLAGLLRDVGGTPEHLEEARHYLEQVRGTGHPSYAPKAAIDLAVGLLEEGHGDAAVPLLEEGAAAADPTTAALAHLHLGLLLVDAATAEAHLRIAQKTGTGQVKTRAAEALRLRRGR
ncbi:hypothetical protein [Actinacidiphila sp. bgisy144]|uniref:hypothetical protein n=1 Tax=unclassified Actinacidiphila TaxID=2995708 RepID=UPI003EBE3435